MQQIIERVLALAKHKCDAAEVIASSGETMPVEFRSGKLHAVEHKEIRGLGLRVIRNGRIGFSSTTDLARLGELVDHAVESAAFGQYARFAFPKSCSGSKVQVRDPRVERYTVDQAIREGGKALAALKQRTPELKCDVSFAKRLTTVSLANSAGLYAGYDKTSFGYSISGLGVVDGSLLFVGDGRRGCGLQVDTARMVAKIATLLRHAKKTGKVANAKLPVLFAHDAMYLFWMALGMGVNGKMLQKKSSPLQGRIGEQLLDKRITVHDDPLQPLLSGSAPYDAEGVCTARLPLFDKGVFRSFVYDLQTAGIMNAQSTGAAQRDFSTQPQPSTSNIVVAAGRHPFAEMVKSIERGVLVYDLLGAGQSNLLAGDFSANIGLGFLIEKGRIVGRVKDAMVAGNVYDLLKNKVLAVSREVEDKGSQRTPAILFKDVSIAAK
ncbi:MAG TPA: metallopeptidase TldD-related protein [Candidatus Edwardsbacteria bacterium]|nr:metallopeptidase TldD-related protein [Candidatus Edwardsbacteria bacterium]